MPTSDGYSQELKRDIYRDLAAKQHLAMRMAQTQRFACDAIETETAEDYCKRMLEKLGLKASTDPIQALSLFLTGHEGALSAMDGRNFSSGPRARPLEGAALDEFIKRFSGKS